ncbi:MAG TPA: sensor histidine kinase, partial [Spirochaetia bacterium]|nr:sensor histidine kinase [Spirochaetia bacterium]
LATAYYRSRLAADRRRIQWLLAGIAIALPPYFFFDQLPIILAGSGMRLSLGSFSQLFLSFIPVFVLIGLTRENRFDPRGFLARYVSYVVLFGCMVALFAVLYLPLRGLLSTGYRLSSPASDLVASAAIVVLLACLRILFENLARRWLRRQSLAPRHSGRTEPDQPEAEEALRREYGLAARRQAVGEQRALIRGTLQRLREPLRRIQAGASAGDREVREAAAQVGGFLAALESLAGSEAPIAATARPRTMALRAMDRVAARFPSVRFEAAGDGTEPVSCYPEEVLRALIAVLENAAESQAEGGSVTVRLDRTDSAVSMEVQDDGPGFGVLARRRLFTPFYTTKPGHQGLGLYLARIAVERCGGALEVVEGEPGGARVRISLPIGCG